MIESFKVFKSSVPMTLEDLKEGEKELDKPSVIYHVFNDEKERGECKSLYYLSGGFICARTKNTDVVDIYHWPVPYMEGTHIAVPINESETSARVKERLEDLGVEYTDGQLMVRDEEAYSLIRVLP